MLWAPLLTTWGWGCASALRAPARLAPPPEASARTGWGPKWALVRCVLWGGVLAWIRSRVFAGRLAVGSGACGWEHPSQSELGTPGPSLGGALPGPEHALSVRFPPRSLALFCCCLLAPAGLTGSAWGVLAGVQGPWVGLSEMALHVFSLDGMAELALGFQVSGSATAGGAAGDDGGSMRVTGVLGEEWKHGLETPGVAKSGVTSVRAAVCVG